MACVAELSTVNAALTSVAVNNTIPLGNVVHQRGTRRGCNGCCNPVLDLAGTNSIIVRESGYYDVDFNATFIAPDPGNVTITMFLNGVPVAGFTGTVTITTAMTQVATLSISAPDIKINCNDAPATISFVVSGADATFSNVAVSLHQI